VGQVWLAKQPITTERLKKWKQQEKAVFAVSVPKLADSSGYPAQLIT
jgi:hypothetical protein